MAGYNPMQQDGSAWTGGVLRYPPLPNGRYDTDPGSRRGPAAEYRSLPFTLEEEAASGGWLPGATPTCADGAPPLQRLYTIGMRGEPDLDDDPRPQQPFNNRYAPQDGYSSGGAGHD